MEKIRNIFADFSREEDGIALTEYLVLLGLLVAGVIGAVITFGGNLETAWENWGEFIQENLGDPQME